MDINPTDQIQSISEFRSNTEELLKILARRKTILLTQHGKAKAVLLDPAAYEEQLERLALVEKILRADREIDDGKSLSHSQVEKLSKDWL